MTAREFAAAIDRPYPTVALWLRQKRIPGAYQETVGDFSLWQIPIEAVDEFKPPALGRPSKKQASTDGEASTTKEAPDDALPTEVTGKKAAKKAGKKASNK